MVIQNNNSYNKQTNKKITSLGDGVGVGVACLAGIVVTVPIFLQFVREIIPAV